MKLHENQLNLIRHLIRFNLMAYEDCLEMLDTDDSKGRTALSYAFRPLTKNKYLSKSKKRRRIRPEKKEESCFLRKCR